jgi:hypothetical protein
VTARREAACRCGGLTAVCEDEPLRIAACHCLACQRRTGSILSAQAWFPADRVTVSGPAQEWSRVSDTSKTITYGFCPTCGSTVVIRHAQLPVLIGVPVGAFADPTFPSPVASIWERRRHPWAVVSGADIEHLD